MIRIDAALRERELKSRMTLQVHDELLIELPPSELDSIRPMVKEQMERVYPLDVPLVADIGVGPNWRDLEY
jgi:DNA polymerase-1